MPPRTNQIKAVAREAQIELWLATGQRANCLIRTQDNQRRSCDCDGRQRIRHEGHIQATSGEAVETAALWKLWEKLNYKDNSSTAPTSLGKLSARNKSAESFPQLPQLRRLTLISEEKPVSRAATRCVRLAGTCLGKLKVNRERGWLPRKCKSQPGRGRSFLDIPLS